MKRIIAYLRCLYAQQFNQAFFTLLMLISLPAGLMLGLELGSLEKQYQRNQKAFYEDIQKALTKSRETYILWNQHTSNEQDRKSYDTLYINADSTFQVMIAQSAQRYPLLDFKPDTSLPRLRREQFLRYAQELEKTRLRSDAQIKELYVLRAVQFCKDCEDKAKSIAQVFPIDSLIRKNLAEKGINTSQLVIGFYNTKQKRYHTLPTQAGKPETAWNSTAHKLAFTPHEEARLVFENENMLLYYSMLRPLLGAFLLLSISFGCAIWATVMLYRQKKLSEMKNDFINNVTHEFKTPIATITFAVANIENEKVLQNPALIKQFTQVIKDENKRLNTQVEKVLQASILENKALELKKEKVDMQTIIQSLATAYEMKAGKEHFQTQFEALQTIVTGDAFHLSNTISNLLDNALKYSGEEVSITIATENTDKMLKISVIDAGIGISPAQQKLIFEKFYRVPTGNVHNVKGFGLGLSYVKAIVEQHKGRVEVESKAGKGSTFSVFLPTA